MQKTTVVKTQSRVPFPRTLCFLYANLKYRYGGLYIKVSIAEAVKGKGRLDLLRNIPHTLPASSFLLV